MHAVIGRVKIKPGHSEETLAMIGDHGEANVEGNDRIKGWLLGTKRRW
jgi:hypothetical protein